MHAMDVMSRPVLTVRSDDSIEQATALLATHNITSAPVVDPGGDLVGMVSESDLLRSRVPAKPERPQVVADVMSKSVVVMPSDADLADVVEAMLYNDVRSVPVVGDDAQLAGIISRRDILQSMVRTDDTVQMEVQHRLDDYAGNERQWTATVRDGIAEIAGSYEDEAEQKIVATLTRSVPGVAEVRFHPSW